MSAASILQRHKLRLTQSGSFFGFFLRFFFLDWRLGPLTLALLGAPTSTRSAGPASADSRRISRVLQPVITAAIVRMCRRWRGRLAFWAAGAHLGVHSSRYSLGRRLSVLLPRAGTAQSCVAMPGADCRAL